VPRGIIHEALSHPDMDVHPPVTTQIQVVNVYYIVYKVYNIMIIYIVKNFKLIIEEGVGSDQTSLCR
jgi:hypothetical protein